jgi:hypothetical protein
MILTKICPATTEMQYQVGCHAEICTLGPYTSLQDIEDKAFTLLAQQPQNAICNFISQRDKA